MSSSLNREINANQLCHLHSVRGSDLLQLVHVWKSPGLLCYAKPLLIFLLSDLCFLELKKAESKSVLCFCTRDHSKAARSYFTQGCSTIMREKKSNFLHLSLSWDKKENCFKRLQNSSYNLHSVLQVHGVSSWP